MQCVERHCCNSSSSRLMGIGEIDRQLVYIGAEAQTYNGRTMSSAAFVWVKRVTEIAQCTRRGTSCGIVCCLRRAPAAVSGQPRRGLLRLAAAMLRLAAMGLCISSGVRTLGGYVPEDVNVADDVTLGNIGRRSGIPSEGVRGVICSGG